MIFYYMQQNKQTILLIVCLLACTQALSPVGDIQLFPNTESSPSLYLIRFSIATALPTDSYLLVGMDWYSSDLQPHSCQLVNTSIPLTCTNFNSPTFPLTITTAHFAKFNSILTPSKMVAIQLGGNILQGVTYALEIHLYNVVPNIQKISPSIEMYTMSSAGLVYEENPNMGAVINSPPNIHLLGVSILNDLAATAPGTTSTLRAEITINQPVSTDLSTFLFTVHHPFSFSIGSIPTTSQSSNYATNPIALYSSPSVKEYEVITPHVFMLTFNQKFVAGRRFIIQINQINNPFEIASSNISIYSLDYNTLIPLEAFEGIYPIATSPYTMPMTLGLTHNAPFQDAMQFYKYSTNYIQISIQVPYSIPDGYSLRLKLTSCTIYDGTVYANFHNISHTPRYDYSKGTSNHIISNFGPIIIGTTIQVTVNLYISTHTSFRVQAFIDKAAVIETFTAGSYVYEGLVEGSGQEDIQYWFQYFYCNRFGWGWRVATDTAFDTGHWFYIRIYQRISSTATSAGSYIEIYLPPTVEVSPSFNSSVDCQFTWVQNSCDIVFNKTATYLKMTIKATGQFLIDNPNPFTHNYRRWIYLRNIRFPETSSDRKVLPIYATLYKSDVVNPTYYRKAYFLSADPRESTKSQLLLYYVGNYYTSTSAANYATYPGALRFECRDPTQMDLVIQPNEELVIAFYARYYFRSMTRTNMDPYPCTSNLDITCTFELGRSTHMPIWMDKVVVRFKDLSFQTTKFHILLPDTPTGQWSNYHWYQVGIYNKITKDYNFYYARRHYRHSGSWYSSLSTYSSLNVDIVGKAGSYRQNVSVNVYNPSITTGDLSYICICTHWSLFENGMTTLSAATLAMTTPATFSGVDQKSALAMYLTSGMYLTVIPFSYTISTQSTFTFWLDNAHMPYSYDLPTYYIYAARQSDRLITASNELIMANGGTLYEAPLQSLVVSCHDNAVGVVNTYCTVVFGTSNPLLADGKIRVAFSGMTVSTSTCKLFQSNGTEIPITCDSSTDNQNVTATMTGWQFYPTGQFTLIIYGIGIDSASISQSMTLYLYDPTIEFVIETGVRILTTTIAGLKYISLTQIMYAYLNPLSYNTMTINFYLPRPLYEDEQFAFIIGEDLSDVNTEVSRMKIQISRQDGTLLYPLYYLDSVNYMIVFMFTDPTLLIESNYTMTIYGISTPVSQLNAFNMIYRRTHDLAYTIVNNYANVIFPEFGVLETSSISLASYYNTEGYKQDIVFTISNINDVVDASMVWVINFPSYYSPDLFQQDAYCTINGAKVDCAVDSTTPYQLLVTNSPVTVNAGTSYEITIVGLASPRNQYTNDAYPQRFIFVGVLLSSTARSYIQRALLLPYQTVQSTVTGVVKVQDMIGVSSGALYSFSSLYAQFQMVCSVDIPSGSHIFIDLPMEFDNLNNIGFNAIILFGSTTISTNTVVLNRKIQVTLTTLISANTVFQVQFPNLPTPMQPCTTQMSTMIVTVTPADRLTVLAASAVQGNSAPRLTFVANSNYISFNHDQQVVITAGTYSGLVPITTNTNSSFLSNVNIQMQSTGFVFEPSSVFLPIGQLQGRFRIGADGSLVPIVYFYEATKQEEVNTNYQITLNMNIKVTNNPVQITIPSSLTLPQGGCTDPFTISLTSPPFIGVTISYAFDNSVYSEMDLFPNPLTTQAQMDFTSTHDNNTFSFCSSSALALGSIPLQLSLTGINYQSYSFSPSNVINLNVVNSVANVTPTLALELNNQQKTFLDVNFTNNVDGYIFYEMILGESAAVKTLAQMQVFTKAGEWLVQSPADFFTFLYTADRDQRLELFFQAAATKTIRIDNLIAESPYTLCGYLINSFSVVSTVTCLNLYTMTWGTAFKAELRFTKTLTAQELNNVICYFTASSSTNQLYLVDSEGNSCGNRSVANAYYRYNGSSFTTQTDGTNIYLFTNPTLTGSDPAPLAFTNLFGVGNDLSSSSLAGAQSMFSITYMTAKYVTSYNARGMTSSSNTAGLSVYYNTPSYNLISRQLTVSNVQILGGVGTVYFVIVHYKTIVVDLNTGSTTVNIKLNNAPSVEQVLNCQNWLGETAQGCARAVYTGVAPLNVVFPSVLSDSLYMMYYVVASEFPLRPVVSTAVVADTVVTYVWEPWVQVTIISVLVLLLMV